MVILMLQNLAIPCLISFYVACLKMSQTSSIDVTLSILRRWRIVCLASEKFGAGLGE